MVADLLAHVAIALVDRDILKGLALNKTQSQECLITRREEQLTSIGLKGLAMRPIVEE